jgi:aspartate aminotransferase-like enzyme
MVNHRGPEFAVMMSDIIEGLKPYFGTRSEPLLLTGSGTGAQEAAVVNMFSPGDTVVSATCGVFGDRFAAIAGAFGADVLRVQGEWGKPISAGALRAALEASDTVHGVLLTHNETSTGVTNDIRVLAGVVRAATPNALILVDGVSSIGALPFAMDEWDVDVAITGSQKAWMSPPGVAVVAVSERGWEAQRQATMPRFYWDFAKAQKNGASRTTPFTPAVGTLHAVHEALRLMTEETPDGVFERHRQIGKQVRAGVQALGLELFADPSAASDTVTAVRAPSGHDASASISGLRKKGIVVASGQDWLKGSIIRIGHMGWVNREDIDAVLDALRAVLAEEKLLQAG